MGASELYIRQMKNKFFTSILRILIAVSAALIVIWIYIAQPTTRQNSLSKITVDEQRLRSHVEMLSKIFYPRNYRELENLNKTADYIKKHFENAGANVEIQEFVVSGKIYKNIIGIFGKGKSRKLIIGAHYDACEETPGADDNASGVAGLIELAYLLGSNGTEREIELVAYSLEEPPYFRSPQMGSYAHAAKIEKEKSKIVGVIVLEMIGYFSDEWGSQSYPMPLLKMMYPSRGNFITVVGRLDQRKFTKAFKIGMKGVTDLPVFSINAPESLPGIDFSDHRNYWPLGLNAIMISDTAFYRNKGYHGLNDTSERLDYKKMAKVVISVFEAMKEI